MGLDLGEGHLDGVEVRAVGRQELQDGAFPLDCRPHGRKLVGGQVVHHDDVSVAQRRPQDLIDVSEKGRTAHGAVERHRGGDARQPESTDEGRRLPMPMGNRSAAALATWCAAVHAGHLGGGAAFIDEHQPLRVQVRLGVEPGLTAGSYVRSILFGSVRCLFFRVTP